MVECSRNYDDVVLVPDIDPGICSGCVFNTAEWEHTNCDDSKCDGGTIYIMKGAKANEKYAVAKARFRINKEYNDDT